MPQMVAVEGEQVRTEGVVEVQLRQVEVEAVQSSPEIY